MVGCLACYPHMPGSLAGGRISEPRLYRSFGVWAKVCRFCPGLAIVWTGAGQDRRGARGHRVGEGREQLGTD